MLIYAFCSCQIEDLKRRYRSAISKIHHFADLAPAYAFCSCQIEDLKRRYRQLRPMLNALVFTPAYAFTKQLAVSFVYTAISDCISFASPPVNTAFESVYPFVSALNHATKSCFKLSRFNV